MSQNSGETRNLFQPLDPIWNACYMDNQIKGNYYEGVVQETLQLIQTDSFLSSRHWSRKFRQSWHKEKNKYIIARLVSGVGEGDTSKEIW